MDPCSFLRKRCSIVFCLAVAAAQGARAAPLPPQTAAPRASVVSQGLVGTGGNGNAGFAALVAATPDAFTGTLSHRIAIDLPEGGGGLTPSVALQYGSDRGSGFAGMGWSVELGAIERNAKFGVSYAADDYALHLGGRAELVNVGGTEYRAKIESDFKRVRKLSGTGGTYWEVTDRNGVRYTFGSTSDSRQENPNDASQTFKWCLDRVDDPDGNYYTVRYFRDSGDIYPESVSYTGNGTSAPKHLVRFWKDAVLRTDAAAVYGPNFGVTTRYRLQSIEVRTNVDADGVGVVDRVYALDYETSGSTARSRLRSVTRIGSDGTVSAAGVASGTPLPATSFTYTVGTPPGSASTPGPSVRAAVSTTNVVNADLYRVLYGDFNGDGRTDVAYVDGVGTTAPMKIFIANGTGFNPAVNGPSRFVGTSTTAVMNDVARVKLADFNADGRTDILALDSSSAPIAVFLARADGSFSSGASFYGPTVLGGTPDVDVSRVFVADFDGDARSDVLYVPSPGYSAPTEVYLSTGSGFRQRIAGPSFGVATGTLAGISSLSRIKLGDFNGDGRTEIAFVNGVGQSLPMTIYGLNATQTGFSLLMNGPTRSVRSDTQGSRIDAMRVFAADVNGDKKTDLVALEGWGSTAAMSIYLATGTAFTAALGGPSRYFDSIYPDQSIGRLRIGDFNGDGRADLAFVEGSQGTSTPISIYLSQGNRYGAAISGPPRAVGGGTALATELVRIVVGDFDGDGRADFAGNNSNGAWTPMSIYPAQGLYPDLLSGVQNGIGGSIAIAYTPSTAYENTQLPFPVQTVASTTTDDGNAGAATTTYAYARGYFHLREREFRGFNLVSARGPAGPDGEQAETRSEFHQGNDVAADANDPSGAPGYTSGKPYRVEVWDLQRATFTETLTTYWAATGPSWFAPVFETRTRWCEQPVGQAEACGRGTLTSVATFDGAGQPVSGYDTWGNPLRLNDYGDEADTTDDRTLVREYQPNTTSWIVGLPARETFYAGAGATTTVVPDPTIPAQDNRLAQTTYLYDGTLDPATCSSAGASAVPAKGNLTRKTTWLNGGTSPEEWTGYDGRGNAVCRSDPDRRITRWGYDGSGAFKTTETNAKTQVTTTTYYGVDGVAQDKGRYGQVKKIVDPNGIEVRSEWDLFGRKTLEQKPAVPAPRAGDPYPGFSVATSYFLGGVGVNRTEALTSDGLWTVEYFDGLGRTYLQKKKGSSRSGARVFAQRTELNGTGTKRRVSLPYEDVAGAVPRWITYAYDAQGRVVLTTRQDATTVVECRRDLDGSAVAIDPLGHRKRNVTDLHGNMVRVQEYRGTFTSCTTDEGTPYATTQYGYDRMRRVTSITDAAGTVSAVGYDTLGRVAFTSDPDLDTWYFGYSAAGDVLTQQDANGAHATPAYLVRMEYDELHRVTLKDYPAGVDARSTYDDPAVPYSIGRLTSRTDGSGTTSYAFDAVGRTIRHAQTINGTSYTMTTGYDPADRIVTEGYPDPAASVATYGYDADGFLGSVTVDGVTYATLSGYNALGQVGNVSYANGVATARTYYDAGNNRLKRIATSRSGAIVDLTYAYDDARNVSGISDARVPTQSWTYGYDELNRVTSATSTATGALSYSYSEIGNITFKEGISYTYHPIKVHAVVGTSDGRSWRYDWNGNLLGDGTRTVAWDYDNRPTSIASPAATAQITYDALGTRVKKQVTTASGTKTTVYAGRLYECTDGACTRHVFAGKERVASLSAAGARYYHTDHLGSTRATTDQTGAVVENVFYEPYGESAPGAVPYRFTGKEFDSESGVYFYGARYYEPWLGRFVSPDPSAPDIADPQTLNRYTYGRDNPIFYEDPTGLAEVDANLPVEFVPGGGHHFVPEAITNGLEDMKLLEPGAARVFRTSKTGWGAGLDDHGWNLGHKEYNAAVKQEILATHRTGKITEAQAQRIVEKLPKMGTDTPRGKTIRGFLDKQLRVANMVKAGRPAGEINAYIRQMQFGLTRNGGYTRGAGPRGGWGGIGGALNAFGWITGITGLLADEADAKRYKDAGWHWLPFTGLGIVHSEAGGYGYFMSDQAYQGSYQQWVHEHNGT